MMFVREFLDGLSDAVRAAARAVWFGIFAIGVGAAYAVHAGVPRAVLMEHAEFASTAIALLAVWSFVWGWLMSAPRWEDDDDRDLPEKAFNPYAMTPGAGWLLADKED